MSEELDKKHDGREAAVGPLEHVLSRPLVHEVAIRQEGDDPPAEAGAHLYEIDLGDMNETALLVEASLEREDGPGVAS